MVNSANTPALVMVPGAWMGDWIWTDVVSRLRADGYAADSLTLRGLEPQRPADEAASVTLAQHVDDVLALLDRQSGPVVLVGHSYSGVVIGQVADRRPDLVVASVHLGSFLPRDGRSLLDDWGDDADARTAEQQQVQDDGHLWAPPPAEMLEAEDELAATQRDWLSRRLVAHPGRTVLDPAVMSLPMTEQPVVYVSDTNDDLPPELAQGLPARWRLEVIGGGHWPMLTRLDEVHRILAAAADRAAVEKRTIAVGESVRLSAEARGPQGAPALLLIGAATWSMDWWRDDFCAGLVEERFRVIRYDARDTGASTSDPVGEPGYGPDDLVGDAVAVLDAFGVERACVMGISMGGGVAQRLAARHRDRVETLVLLSTTPADSVERDLPDPSPEVAATFTEESPDPDWSDRDAAIEAVVAGERPYAGPGNFDEPEIRQLAGRVYDRTPDMAPAMTNHFMVMGEPGSPIDLTALSDTPTLVVHGSADPLFPVEHAEALRAAIPNAELLVLDDVGHQLPPPHTWGDLFARVRGLAETRAEADS